LLSLKIQFVISFSSVVVIFLLLTVGIINLEFYDLGLGLGLEEPGFGLEVTSRGVYCLSLSTDGTKCAVDNFTRGGYSSPPDTI